ncbi:hypothetical protein DFH07DRAFT_32923 [Mycena maculata]|uniref:INO80 complex subunit B-like conserved region domain-containing protein n=1 Tax=Mycena maculata TaxID=230809 RepID=A0AAD7K2G5_9AGAR|nr:hypothetical protein DFH07DRAFT_32923 [Mycena maculata]
MQISNDDEPQAKSKSDPDSMDVDEEPQSEEEQVEVDVLPDAGSDSEASDAAEGEPEVEEPEEYELEDEEDEIQESRSPSVAAPPAKSPLKIKFKVRPGAVTRGRRTRATAIQVESEDSEESESEQEMPQNVRLTKRQAALAKARKGVASSETSAVGHVVLAAARINLSGFTTDHFRIDEEEDPVPNKKRAALDPSEVALRKEESARKRRHVSEKKLQNEKAETINRLLKKQSRPRNKRTTALSTATPVEVPTPVAASEAAGSVADVIEERVPEPEKDPEPTMYRWISTSRPTPTPDTASDENAPPSVMRVSFSVPTSVTSLYTLPAPVPPEPRPPAVCGVKGCGKDRRYRLVGGEWGAGACGMGHLKLLKGQ